MASCVLATVEQESLANALNTDIGGGTLNLYTGASPGPNRSVTGTLVASIPIPAAALNTVTGGVIMLGAIPQVAAVAPATAGGGLYARILTSAPHTSMDLDVGDPGSGASIELINLDIATTQPVSITSGTITVPAGS